ncbi:hypothetical protein [Paenibacillus gorillae]|uniref:hypothetical protein n=1 Tax=Paenibacillus gorillae TaxID=1243662 RepID=UPI0004AD0E59|nr:hypothetical protein [Paenibacillus gorillae]
MQEKQMQNNVEQFLNERNIPYEREKRLDDKDIPDFLIDGIVLEVKTKCSNKAIYRQLERYSRHENVTGLLLLTGTSMHLPPTINDKPALIAPLGMGWL